MKGAAARMRWATTAIAMLMIAASASTARADAPIVDFDLIGTDGQGGWYVSAVTVAWTIDWRGGTPDPTTDCPYTQLVTQDTTPTGTTRSCTAVSSLGTTTGTTTAFRLDRTKPTVTSSAAQRQADHRGWFNRPLEIVFAGSDASSGIASCATTSYAGPDTPGTSVNGTCRDQAGNVSAPSGFELKYDATAPQISGLAPERPADAFGYFLRPVALAFTGTDETSGILGCDTVTYAGPDSAAGQVSGSCRDVAGNSATGTMAVAFDATAPALSKVSALAGDSVATLSWERSPDAQTVRVLRKPGPARPVFDGAATKFEDRGLKNGIRYSYTLTAIDAAGHETTRAVAASPSAKLIAPAAGASVKAPPRLSWKRVSKARYYNVQLFRGKRKIMSAWPRRTRLQLRSAWRYDARWQRLSAGTYRWYVWPGYGDRAQRRYGRALGSRTFTMP